MVTILNGIWRSKALMSFSHLNDNFSVRENIDLHLSVFESTLADDHVTEYLTKVCNTQRLAVHFQHPFIHRSTRINLSNSKIIGVLFRIYHFGE